MNQRSSGILLHISSLPSVFGIGDFGPEGYKFVDFLAESKQAFWQILPLNPTDPINGNSPYTSTSAFAINTLFISPEGLIQEGLLEHSDLRNKPFFPDGKVEYLRVIEYKKMLLERSFKSFQSSQRLKHEYKAFEKKNNFWLEDYSMFTVINEQLSSEVWTNWPDGLKNREEDVLNDFQKQFKDEIICVKFYQFIAAKQWEQLRTYCKESGVQIMGDIPIYVNFDSADVWTNPKNYKLDKNNKPSVVAGVPPDYFSKTGQRWGNPVYNWDKLKKDKFSWWINRMKRNLMLYDMIRIDHFRGLVQYWEIPFEEITAINGKWADVPTEDFLKSLQKNFDPLPIIAEDLGHITDDVREVMEHYDLPGMKVLMFAFGGDMQGHPYLPHNYKKNCVVYTGTHDNNTVKGWYKFESSNEERQHLKEYIGATFDENEIHWHFIDLALSSEADLAIIPMQDVLGLDNSHRMNKPATIEGNWEWRLLPDAIDGDLVEMLFEHTENAQRSYQPILG